MIQHFSRMTADIRPEMKSSIMLLAVFPVIGLLSGAAPLAAEAPTRIDEFQSKVKPFLETYCADCHGPDKPKADLSLHNLQGEFTTDKQLERWDGILERLGRAEMPPRDAQQPSDAERKAVAGWIESGLRDYVNRNRSASPAPATRRLTNVEYENTLRDLLGFQFEVLDDLPEDPEKLYHFNNTAELMRIGPERLKRYLEIARRAMNSAIVDPQRPEVYHARREWNAGGNDRGMGLDEVGVWGNRRHSAADGLTLKGFPKTGQFRIRMKASAILPPGFGEAPLQLDLGTPPGRTETPYKTVATIYLTNSPDDPRIFEFTGRIENHPYTRTRVGKSGGLVDQMAIKPRVVFDDGTLGDGGTYAKRRQLEMPRAVIHSIEFEAPVVDIWPPRHHTDILFPSPLRETKPEAYIREVLRRFITRAYRRPATEEEIAKFARIYGLVHPSAPSMEHAVRETLAMVLIGPPFLYHTEAHPATGEHYAMASKLSYFLWASMPDRELFDLAAKGRLKDPLVLREQVSRMLADKKSASFIENFALQWLSVEKALTVPINEELFPRFLYRVPNGETAGTEVPYRPTVRDYMLAETVGFVGELIRRNESMLSVVDSDFAYLNERLARHYGVDGVRGMRMRVVPLERPSHLGGLLTHGSVLLGNGTGTAPHPIYRAVWLREAILGEKVPPPPAEVPALSDTAGESLATAVSIADLLARHRKQESCRDCHARLDPWGLPFEEYNAIGRYQPLTPKDGTRVSRFDKTRHGDLDGYQAYLDSINTVPVNARALAPDGPEIDGVRQLKDYLLEHRRDDVARNVLRRLLAYGIGRELTFRDRFTVETLFKQSAANGFKMRDAIVAICQSPVFQDTALPRDD